MLLSDIRCIHLSDFHVGKDNYAQIRMFGHILDHIKEKIDSKWVPDFIFITGDLANKGLRSEYDIFCDEFLFPLWEIIGGDIFNRTFTIPGNHDVEREVNPGFDRDIFSNPEEKYFDPTSIGRSLRKVLVPRFQNFIESDLTSQEGWLNSDSSIFALVETIRGVRIGIAGINTSWLCRGNDDQAKLTIGQPLLTQALSQSKQCDLQIVLGHHPLNWLRSQEEKMARSLLGQSFAIYLHGHLHDAWAEPTYGGGYNFLSVQCGAGFQTRANEKWRNGFMFGEVSGDNLRLQPWTWRFDHQDWGLYTDAFSNKHRSGEWWLYDLPASQKPTTNVVQRIRPPGGWSISSLDDLRKNTHDLETSIAVNFFNGAVPDWTVALSHSIPRRRVVETIVKTFDLASHSGKPIVGLLKGAGCEGKSTAIRQSSLKFLEEHSDWKILYRDDETKTLDVHALLSLFNLGNGWLVVIDEADNVSEQLIELIDSLLPHHKVHFLLACRDSDWTASKSSQRPWASVSKFHQIVIQGLESEEATSIIHCWEEFGQFGLGHLSRVPPEDRVGELIKASLAEENVNSNQGAFFGALLTVRFGDDLNNHAKVMLDRLSTRNVPGGKNLGEALAFIAAMHAEGLYKLSRPVLANALDCNLSELQGYVIRPLGAEAASTTSSNYIFVRHKRIARAILEVMASDFGQEIEKYYSDLAWAAINLKVEQSKHVPDLSFWRHEFPEHFFNADRPELAIEIAQALFDGDRSDFRSLVTLANICRRSNSFELAINLFRNFPEDVSVERGFYNEWGLCEFMGGNKGCGILLCAFALSDQYGRNNVTGDDVFKGMGALATIFPKLYNEFLDEKFIRGYMAVAAIGRILSHEKQAVLQRYVQDYSEYGYHEPSIGESVEIIKESIIHSGYFSSCDEMSARIGTIPNFTYAGLAGYVERAYRMTLR